MSYCLYLIQSEYGQTASVIDKMRKTYTSGDAVVLMGEAALWAETADLSGFKQVYVLEHDAQALSTLPTQIQLLSYAEFADICLAHTRCIRLK